MDAKSREQKLFNQLRVWKWSSIILATVLALTLILGLFSNFQGNKILTTLKGQKPTSSLLEQLQNNPNFDAVQNQIQGFIDTYYVGNKPTNDKFNQSLLKGYVDSLGDKYSVYLTKQDYSDITNSLNASFSGIGVSFEYQGTFAEVQTVFDDTPAKAAGILIGDRIVKVDGVDISSMGSSDVVRSKITGPENSSVKLNIISGSDSKDVTIIRKNISFPIVTMTKSDNIAVIKVSSFGEKLDIEMNKVATAIKADTSITRIVLDMTNNGGGYLNGAVDLVSYFVDPNQTVVVEKTKAKEEILSTLPKSVSLKDYPLVVTANQYTASASEITLGALQDLRKVTFVGSKTYGKGVVQQIFKLNSGDALKLTIAEWLTPKKRTINLVGLNPDIFVAKDEVKTVLEKFSWDTNTLR